MFQDNSKKNMSISGEILCMLIFQGHRREDWMFSYHKGINSFLLDCCKSKETPLTLTELLQINSSVTQSRSWFFGFRLEENKLIPTFLILRAYNYLYNFVTYRKHAAKFSASNWKIRELEYKFVNQHCSCSISKPHPALVYTFSVVTPLKATLLP